MLPCRLTTALLVVPLVRPMPKAEVPTAKAEVPGPSPQLWLATDGDARVYIFGFGEAKDTSSAHPSVRRAFEQSSELWLETAGPGAPTNQSPAERRAAAEQ